MPQSSPTARSLQPSAASLALAGYVLSFTSELLVPSSYMINEHRVRKEGGVVRTTPPSSKEEQRSPSGVLLTGTRMSPPA